MPTLYNFAKKKGVFMIPSGGTKSPTPTPPSFSNTKSLAFDGVDDYVDLGSGLDIFRYNINESYTISLWYKTTSALGDKTIINLGANAYRFTLASASSGKITFGAGNSSTVFVTYNWLPTAGAINDGNWHHICVVQDSSGGSVNLKAYVDGSSSGAGISTTFITEINNRIGFGNYGGVSANIDEVSIFDSALTSGNVTSIYNSGTPTDLTSLSPVAWYRMGDKVTSWATIPDQVGSNDGTATNMDIGDIVSDVP